MMNHDEVRDLERERCFSSWRGIGGVAAGLLARAEARREEAARLEEPRFVPVAWAAE